MNLSNPIFEKKMKQAILLFMSFEKYSKKWKIGFKNTSDLKMSLMLKREKIQEL